MPRRQAFDHTAPRPTTAKLLCNHCGRDFGKNASTQAALMRGAEELAQHILVCDAAPPTNDSIDVFQNSRRTDELSKLEALQAFHEEQARKLQQHVDHVRGSGSVPNSHGGERPATHNRTTTHHTTTPTSSGRAQQPHAVDPFGPTPRVRARQNNSAPDNALFTGEDNNHPVTGTNTQSFDLFSGNQTGWAAQSVRVRCQYCGKGQAEHKLRQHEATCAFRSPVDSNLPPGAHLPANCGEVEDRMGVSVRRGTNRSNLKSTYGSNYTNDNTDSNHSNFTTSTRERRTIERRNPHVGKGGRNGLQHTAPVGGFHHNGRNGSYSHSGPSSSSPSHLTRSVPEHMIRQMQMQYEESEYDDTPPQPRRVQSLRTAQHIANDMYNHHRDDLYQPAYDEEDETYDIGAQTSIRVPKEKGGAPPTHSSKPRPPPKSSLKKFGPAPSGGDLNGRAKARDDHLKDNRPYWEKLAPKMNMEECPICGRTFADDRISKHQAICEKNVKRRIVSQHGSVPGR